MNTLWRNLFNSRILRVIERTRLTHVLLTGRVTIHAFSTNPAFSLSYSGLGCYNSCLLMQKTIYVFTLDCPKVQFICFMWIHLLPAHRPYQSLPAKAASGMGQECLGVEEESGLHSSRIVVADVVSRMVIVGVSKVRKGSVKKRIPLTEDVFPQWCSYTLDCKEYLQLIFGRKKINMSTPVLVDLKVLCLGPFCSSSACSILAIFLTPSSLCSLRSLRVTLDSTQSLQ